MNRWYLAGHMLRQKDAVIPVIGFAVCFVWLLSACGAYFNLYQVLREPAVIYGEVPTFSGELRQYVTELDGIEAVTRLSKTAAEIQWEDYSGSISVYGVETEYMEWLAKENLSSESAFSEGMAYGILSESAAGNLKKHNQTQSIQSFGVREEKTEKKLVLMEGDLMKDFSVGESNMVRLYGLIGDSSDADGDAFEDTSVDKMAGLFLSEKWYAEFFSNAGESGSEAVLDMSATQTLLMNVSHGYQVKEILKRLAANNVTGQSSVTGHSETVQEECMMRLYTGIIILICSICLLVYQEKLWKERHQDAIEDLGRFFGGQKAVRSIFRRRRILLIIAGIAGSFVWQWISTVFELL